MRRLPLPLLAAAAVSAGVPLSAPVPAAARTAGVVPSSNWAGYAVTGRSFRRVVAAWTVHAAHCPSGVDASEVTWVGLGGDSPSSRHLEQAGTSLDCTPSGPSYHTWYELVPTPLHTLPLRVRPGDRVAASVTAIGHRVKVVVRNRTRHRHLVRHLHMANPDTSSAEWIAEAPTKCFVGGSCQTAPLADFGSVAFGQASTTTRHGRHGTIADSLWTATPIELVAAPSGSGGAGTVGGSATPGPLRRGGSAFSVHYVAGATAASVRHTRAFLPTRVR